MFQNELKIFERKINFQNSWFIDRVLFWLHKIGINDDFKSFNEFQQVNTVIKLMFISEKHINITYY